MRVPKTRVNYMLLLPAVRCVFPSTATRSCGIITCQHTGIKNQIHQRCLSIMYTSPQANKHSIERKRTRRTCSAVCCRRWTYARLVANINSQQTTDVMATQPYLMRLSQREKPTQYECDGSPVDMGHVRGVTRQSVHEAESTGLPFHCEHKLSLVAMSARAE